jgi:hypothetical protein
MPYGYIGSHWLQTEGQGRGKQEAREETAGCPGRRDGGWARVEEEESVNSGQIL